MERRLKLNAAQKKGIVAREIFDRQPMLSVSQIARMTGRSRRTIIRWFQDEPGVLLIPELDHPEKMHKRRYRTLRIPPLCLSESWSAKKLC